MQGSPKQGAVPPQCRQSRRSTANVGAAQHHHRHMRSVAKTVPPQSKHALHSSWQGSSQPLTLGGSGLQVRANGAGPCAASKLGRPRRVLTRPV